MTHEFKPGDVFKVRGLHGSFGVVTDRSTWDRHSLYVTYYYGVDGQGEHVTATGNISSSMVEPVTPELFWNHANSRFNTPRCRTCWKEVREGLLYCAGLSDCWKKGVGLI